MYIKIKPNLRNTSLPESIGNLFELDTLSLDDNPLLFTPFRSHISFTRESEIDCQRYLQFYRDWQVENFLPKVTAMLENQSLLNKWIECWPYWVKYRDYFLPLCDQHPGPLANQIKRIINTRERVKLNNTDYEMIL